MKTTNMASPTGRVKRLATISSIVIEISSALIIILFLYTAISKSINMDSTIAAINKTPFFSNNATLVGWSVVILEYVCAATLIFPKTKRIGFIIASIMMLGFTAYITLMKIFVPHLPCSCGGAIAGMSWDDHLLLNICFTILAFLGAFLSKRASKIGEREEIKQVAFT